MRLAVIPALVTAGALLAGRLHRMAHRPAGQLARDHPRLWIVYRGRDRATFAGTADPLLADGCFDVALVLAGGNDVIRLRAADALRADCERTVELARAWYRVLLAQADLAPRRSGAPARDR